MTEKRNVLILRGEAYQGRIYEYLTDERFAGAHRLFNNRKFSTGDIDVPYRVINHWEMMGLLPEGMEAEGWRKFTLIELVWIRAIATLREFGVGLEKIHRARRVMKWDRKRQQYPEFEFYAALSLWSDTDSYIIVLEDGTADLTTLGELGASQTINKDAFKSMILIPFRLLLKEFSSSSKNPPVKLTKEEAELLHDIRSAENDEVRVAVNDAGEIKQIENAKTFNHADFEKNREINKGIKMEGMYGKVETQYENGDRRSVKVVKRKRFDK